MVEGEVRRHPARVTVQVYDGTLTEQQAKPGGNNAGQGLFVIIKLGKEKMRTAASDGLKWNERCNLKVSSPDDELSFSLKVRPNTPSRGKWKIAVRDIPAGQPPTPQTISVTTPKGAPVCTVNCLFWISEWSEMDPMEGAGTPRMRRAANHLAARVSRGTIGSGHLRTSSDSSPKLHTGSTEININGPPTTVTSHSDDATTYAPNPAPYVRADPPTPRASSNRISRLTSMTAIEENESDIGSAFSTPLSSPLVARRGETVFMGTSLDQVLAGVTDANTMALNSASSPSLGRSQVRRPRGFSVGGVRGQSANFEQMLGEANTQRQDEPLPAVPSPATGNTARAADLEREVDRLRFENSKLQRKLDQMEPTVLSPLRIPPTATKNDEKLPPGLVISRQPPAIFGFPSVAPLPRPDLVTRTFTPGFHASFCGCGEDISGCLLSTFLPCVSTAKTAALVEERGCTVCDVCFTNAYTTRQSLRATYGLGYSETADCLLAVVCHCCVVSQNARELALHTKRCSPK